MLCRRTVIGVQGEKQRAKDAPLGGPSTKSQCGGGGVADLHRLWSVRQEVQDPAAQRGADVQGPERRDEFGWDDAIKGRN